MKDKNLAIEVGYVVGPDPSRAGGWRWENASHGGDDAGYRSEAEA